MADVRALLKAKREEKRISHPFAAYNPAGQLRCIACSIIVKQASAWNGHLGSKTHRTNAARVKEEERRKEALEEEKRQGKRKAIEDGDEDFEDGEATKRQRVEDQNEQPSAASPLNNSSTTSLPAGFFSDPSRTLTTGETDSDEEEGDKDNPPLPIATVEQPAQSGLDLEWAKFQETVINAPVDTDVRETFDRATIFAEPELSNEIPEGFPLSSVVAEPNEAAEPDTALKDAGEDRRRRNEEEKELIMDRLLDEERAQEEADDRVNALKARLDLLKQRRKVARSTRAKK